MNHLVSDQPPTILQTYQTSKQHHELSNNQHPTNIQPALPTTHHPLPSTRTPHRRHGACVVPKLTSRVRFSRGTQAMSWSKSKSATARAFDTWGGPTVELPGASTGGHWGSGYSLVVAYGVATYGCFMMVSHG